MIEGNARKAIFGLCVAVSPKPYELGQRLVLISNKKPILCTRATLKINVVESCSGINGKFKDVIFISERVRVRLV